MAFLTLEKAVELKKLIDTVHRYLPRMGRCVSVEEDFKESHFIDDEDDSPERNNIITIQENSVVCTP
jgi:hypothetical protein